MNFLESLTRILDGELIIPLRQPEEKRVIREGQVERQGLRSRLDFFLDSPEGYLLILIKCFTRHLAMWLYTK
jgi:hypothetical protein